MSRPARLLQAAESRVLAARAVLWIESLARHLWPAAALLAALAGLALSGLPSLLPPALHAAGLLLALLGLGWVLRKASPVLTPPATAAGERRLERDSGLRHRPFETLRDRLAGGGEAETLLWTRHQAEARIGLSRLRLAPPRPDLPAHDPRALRAAALLLLVAGIVVAGPRAGDRLAAGLLPGLPDWLRAGPPPVVQAWIQPPAYTGAPPIFLPADGAAADAPVTVPEGSRLTVGVSGLGSTPTLSLAGHALKVEALGAGSYQATTVLGQGGRLRLGRRFSSMAGWTLALLPNEPPVISWPSPPGRAGTSLSTSLPWRVQQRWGVASLEADVQPEGRPLLPSRHIRLPLPGTPRQASGSATPDLSADPYAGLTVGARLEARDVSGQHGHSDTRLFILPARIFHHPLARAIVALRQRLAVHPDARQAAADDLSALAEAPLAVAVPGLPGAGIALNLSAASALLGAPGATAAQVAEVQARLWTLALALDGALPDASARALAEARDDLRRGIEDHAGGKLSDKALSQRLDALRQALQKRLTDLAGRALKQGALQKFDSSHQHLSAPAIDRAISRLEQALRAGKTDEARQRLAELERMIDQLKNAHIMSPEEARQQQQQAKTGRQQMGAVQDMVQRETTLLDHAQARGGSADPAARSEQPNPFFHPPQEGTEDPAQDPSPFSQPPPDASDAAPLAQDGPRAAPRPLPTGRDDARTQRALDRALGALKDGLAQAGRKKPASLDDADHAMQDAATALAGADDPMARDAIARAIAALQQGGQDMARQGGQQGGGGLQLSLQPGGQSGGEGDEGSDENGDGQGGEKRDPFGRPVDGNGTVADDPGLRVPDAMEQGRSQAIQKELRSRGADRSRPKEELDYIGRLLKPF